MTNKTTNKIRTLTKEEIASEYPPSLVASWVPENHIWIQSVGWVGKNYDRRESGRHYAAVSSSWDNLLREQMSGWLDDETFGDKGDIIFANGSYKV